MFNYWFKKWNLLYKLAYGLVSLAMRYFYKKYEILGIENIPKDGGVLFAVNHQNAFMDPIVIASQLEENLYGLTRSDIFKNNFVTKILRSVYMLPVFRQRDRVNTIEANEETFNECYELLNNNNYIIIFPEGDQSNKKRLRKLKKGVARIGLGAANKINFKKPTYIVPIGLNYSNYTNMGATLLINFGEAIPLEYYYKNYQIDAASTINNVTSRVKSEMTKLILNIESDKYEQVHSLLFINNNINETYCSLHDELIAHQELVKKLKKYEEEDFNRFQTLCINTDNLNEFVENNKLHYKSLKNQEICFKVLPRILLLIFLSPIHLLSLISNYLPYKIPVWFVAKKVKDQHFHSSVKIMMGSLLFLIFWLVQTAIVAMFSDNYIWFYYLLSLPVLALFSYKYWILLLKTKGHIRYNRLIKTGEIKLGLEYYNSILRQIESC